MAAFVSRAGQKLDHALAAFGIDVAGLTCADLGQVLDDLVKEMDGMTADDLQDTVHRRFEFRLCPPCQRRFLANPLGKPRSVRVAEN